MRAIKTMKFIIFLAIFWVNALINTSIAAAPNSKIPEAPTSSIPSGTDYKSPCYLGQISTENANLKSITIPLDPPRTFTIAQLDKDSNLKNISTKHDMKIIMNCATDNYVFNPDAKSLAEQQQSFEMKCNNGSFAKVKKTDFCDQKCDISRLKEAGYIISGETTLLPGASKEISCPAKKTTRTGPKFNIECLKDGLLKSDSPVCFDESKACKHDGISYDQNSQLSCQRKGIGLSIVSCNNKKWESQEAYAASTECKANLADLNFKYEDLNEVSITTQESIVTIKEILDFCEQNPNDSECQVTYPTCNFLPDATGLEDYTFGHELVLKCPYKNGDKAVYTCLDDWVFIGLSGGEAAYETIRIEECGKRIEKCEDGKNDCERIEILESKPPKKPEKPTQYKSETLKGFKATGI